MELTPRMVKFAVLSFVLFFVTLFAGCQVLSHSVTVQAGEAGIVYKHIGDDAGIQPVPLKPGWHWRPLFTDIIPYPTRERIYPFTADKDKNSSGRDESIAFADKNGMGMSGDVQLSMRILPQAAPALYNKYKLPFESDTEPSLLYGPIYNDLRSFINIETQKLPVTCDMVNSNASTGTASDQAVQCDGQIMGSGREPIIQKVAAEMKAKWASEGVEINDVRWIGKLTYPPAVTQAILARQAAVQATQVAEQRRALAHANADAAIETARGEAESTKLRAQAIASSPQLIEQMYAERSKGICPPGTKTCIVGSQAGALIGGGGD